MSTVWHILWPGWATVLGSIWLGILSLPAIVPLQVWLSRRITRRAVVQATQPLHERIASLEAESYR